MMTIAQELLNTFVQHGCQARCVAARHIQDLQAAIHTLHQQGMFDEDFYQERLTPRYTFQFPEGMAQARTLCVVAVPCPPTYILFEWNGKEYRITLPPTYVGYDRIAEEARELAARVLEPAGYQVRLIELPLKLLATSSGLGQYGRNNICYVPGLGSYHELVALCSDLPCEQDDWQAPQPMQRCQQCTACQKLCPTRAIPADRFLLRAERCLTFHNEKAPQIPFPEWIEPAVHNSLLGCMVCQSKCPENRARKNLGETAARFSRTETDLLLRAAPLEELPADTIEKLKQLDLLECRAALPRNLKVLIEA